MRTIAFYNAKGGTAKTTSAVNIAAAIAARRKRVLILDVDPQASATIHVGMEPNDNGAAAVLFDNAPIARVSIATSTPGLDLVPASSALAAVDIDLASKIGRERILSKALAGVKGFDFLIIDCPPAQGLTAVNALVASQWFVVPVVPSYLAVAGIGDVLDFAGEVKSGIGQCAKLAGIILCQVDRRKRGHIEYAAEVRRGFKCFKTPVPTNAAIEVAPSHGKTIYQYARSSKGAAAYKLLARELLRRTR